MTLDDISELISILSENAHSLKSSTLDFGLICQEYLCFLKVCVTHAAETNWPQRKNQLISLFESLKSASGYEHLQSQLDEMIADISADAAQLKTLLPDQESAQAFIQQMSTIIQIDNNILNDRPQSLESLLATAESPTTFPEAIRVFHEIITTALKNNERAVITLLLTKAFEKFILLIDKVPIQVPSNTEKFQQLTKLAFTYTRGSTGWPLVLKEHLIIFQRKLAIILAAFSSPSERLDNLLVAHRLVHRLISFTQSNLDIHFLYNIHINLYHAFGQFAPTAEDPQVVMDYLKKIMAANEQLQFNNKKRLDIQKLYIQKILVAINSILLKLNPFDRVWLLQIPLLEFAKIPIVLHTQTDCHQNVACCEKLNKAVLEAASTICVNYNDTELLQRLNLDKLVQIYSKLMNECSPENTEILTHLYEKLNKALHLNQKVIATNFTELKKYSPKHSFTSQMSNPPELFKQICSHFSNALNQNYHEILRAQILTFNNTQLPYSAILANTMPFLDNIVLIKTCLITPQQQLRITP